ncbi:MAG: hypothetical protein AAFQ01_03995, partial [Bacteroidota bacterium]
LFIILYVPLIGALLGPLLVSVTAAIVMRELSDLHLVGYIPSEKEMKKMDKKERKAEKKAARKARRRAKRKGLPLPS